MTVPGDRQTGGGGLLSSPNPTNQPTKPQKAKEKGKKKKRITLELTPKIKTAHLPPPPPPPATTTTTETAKLSARHAVSLITTEPNNLKRWLP
jgi:hypothetical protein